MGYEEQVKSEWKVVEGAEPDKSRVSKQVRHMVSAKHMLVFPRQLAGNKDDLVRL